MQTAQFGEAGVNDTLFGLPCQPEFEKFFKPTLARPVRRSSPVFAKVFSAYQIPPFGVNRFFKIFFGPFTGTPKTRRTPLFTGVGASFQGGGPGGRSPAPRWRQDILWTLRRIDAALEGGVVGAGDKTRAGLDDEGDLWLKEMPPMSCSDRVYESWR